MHIAFVCAEFPVFNRPTGGFGTYVKQLTQALIELGHTVTIVCQGDEQHIIAHGKLHIRIITPTVIPLLSFLSAIRFQRLENFLRYPFLFSFAAHQVLEQIDTVEPIHIIEGGDFGAELFFPLLLRKYHTPHIVIKLHTPSFIIRKYNQEKHSLFYQVMERMEFYCLTRVNAIYSPTKALAREVQQLLSLPSQQIIPYPVTPKKTLPKSNRVSPLILYAGKLQTKKGVFILLEAFPEILKKLPDSKLLYIGPDTFENGESLKRMLQIKAKEKKINKNVYFLEPVAQKKLLLYYQHASLVVVPSIWENYPNVLLEAIGSGTVVVASRVGGIPEMVKHNIHAYLVPPNKPHQLAAACIKILSQKRLRNRLRRTAFHFIQSRLAPEKIARKTISFYEHVLMT